MDQELRGRVLFTPSAAAIESAQLTRFCQFLAATRGLQFEGTPSERYAALHHWSVTELGQFWSAIAEFFGVVWRKPPGAALEQATMPFAEWFPGSRINYAEQALRIRDGLAVIAVSEGGDRQEFTYAELRDQVSRCRAGLKRCGVGVGDRVAGYLPNTVEAVVALLATASLGAIWTSCPPEFGASSVLDRFKQIEPKVLIAASGYRYGGKWHDRSAEVLRIHSQLPGKVTLIMLGDSAGAESPWASLLAEDEPIEFEPVPFSHPLWILYSSGTTGTPKAIVHGHGGIVLEHLKVLGLHTDLGPEDRFFWFSTTGWMMWNYLVGGLLLGSTIVLYDGSPTAPDLSRLWQMAQAERVSYFGASAPYLMACRAHKLDLSKFDLSSIRGVGSTGAPLPAEGFEWVYEQLGPRLMLGSASGGTDLCTAFVLGCPWLPVRSGELQCAALGASVQALSSDGTRVIGSVGELVLTEPMPCMPVCFWNDPDGSRLRASYFEPWPQVWRHGDWLCQYADGGAVIFGRSDATLNRGGVRMGTSEFYRVVEELPFVADSLVVDTSELGHEGKLWLFVVLKAGVTDEAALFAELRSAIKRELSPRHVPDHFVAISEVPYTLSGKKLEIPVKRLLKGEAPEVAVNLGTLKNPNALVELAKVVSSPAASH